MDRDFPVIDMDRNCKATNPIMGGGRSAEAPDHGTDAAERESAHCRAYSLASSIRAGNCRTVPHHLNLRNLREWILLLVCGPWWHELRFYPTQDKSLRIKIDSAITEVIC